MDVSNFPPRKRSKDGLDGWCRKCHRMQMMEYYRKNKDAINAKNKPYWKKRYADSRVLRKKDFTKINSLSDTDLAYISGLLDGEGSFNIMAAGPRKGLAANISIAMTSNITLQWLSGKLGGSVSTVRRKVKMPNRKDQFRMQMCGQRAIRLAKRLLPFLVTKREHAVILVELGDLGCCGRLDNKLTNEEISQQRLILKNKIRLLN